MHPLSGVWEMKFVDGAAPRAVMSFLPLHVDVEEALVLHKHVVHCLLHGQRTAAGGAALQRCDVRGLPDDLASRQSVLDMVAKMFDASNHRFAAWLRDVLMDLGLAPGGFAVPFSVSCLVADHNGFDGNAQVEVELGV